MLLNITIFAIPVIFYSASPVFVLIANYVGIVNILPAKHQHVYYIALSL